MDETEFDQQLGPFYMEHGEEFVPVGFEESLERVAETMGTYLVRSNMPQIDGISIAIGHYDLTKYIQAEWDKFTDPANPPRRGFVLSGRSPSVAAGRAAEEIVLERLLWRCKFDSVEVVRVVPFWDLLDEGKIIRPKGQASDDIRLELTDGSIVVVESKASFNGRAPFGRFKARAIAQATSTVLANPHAAHAVLAFVDLKNRSVIVLSTDRESLLSRSEGAFAASPGSSR